MPSIDECERLLHAMRAVNELKRTFKADDRLRGAASVGVLGALEHTGPLRVGELAEHMHVDISVMSRHVAHLEADGHIVRTTDPADRRSSHVALTASGRKVLKAARKEMAGRVCTSLAEWPEEDVALLAQLLERFAADVYRYAVQPDSVSNS